ncbi:MAG: flagellar hook-basal body protein [Tissierellaceae bacterium]
MIYNILNIGKTGLKSVDNKMSAVSDDLSNVNTHGYKRKDISFQELLRNEIYDSEVLLGDNARGTSINAGAKSGIGSINFKQGVIRPSDGEFHMAIDGDGFFGVRDEMGNLMLTRNGGFHINEDRSISDDSGYLLDFESYVPMDEWGEGKINISIEGNIIKELEGETELEEETQLLGRVILYNPEVLDSLIPLGEGRYIPSDDIELYNSTYDSDGFGDIVQYGLEESNVEITKSMLDMITAQRAYSMNTKVIQTTDDILSMINNIKQ